MIDAGERGFTLLEMVCVLAIIALLAAVLLPFIPRETSRSRLPLGGEWAVDNADVPWMPELVRVRVKSPTGAVSDIRTVRLMKRPPE